MATIDELTAKLHAVCPIDGVSVGSRNDKSTWAISFRPDATPEQRAHAHAVASAFDFDAPAVPASVRMWQAKAALAAVGKLEAANAVIAAASGHVAIAWEYATDVSRDSPGLAAAGAAIGLDAEAIDALFIAAEKIKV